MPAVVDLAAMRDAMADLGGDPSKINPLVPVELVIDHSVQVDVFGTRDAFRINAEHEFERNQERYAFLRWGQSAFEGFKVVPPDTGIVHQVNLEYLARVVFRATRRRTTVPSAYPDTLVGTDSHTTMINGLGVLGWGVGGIEAEAAMLGQPMSMLIPQVVGFKLARRAARGRDGDRPRAHRHPDAARARRRRQVRRVLRARRRRTCRSPTARRSATCRRSSARPARSSRSTRRRCATSSSPGARRSASSSSRPTRTSRASGTTRTPRSRRTPRRSSSTSATSCRRWPARSARRTASR